MPDRPTLPELGARSALAEAYRALGRAGLIAGSGGNLSSRVRAMGQDAMLISPTGVTAEAIGPEMVVKTTLSEPAPRASSEWALHAALYQARPELNAVVHTHADACTALACLGEDLPAFHYEVVSFGGGEVRCTAYTTFGTPDLAVLAVAGMEGRTACLLGNHGMITAGASLDQAVAAAFQLERLCRQYLLALAAGRPRLLSGAQVAEAQVRFRSYHTQG